MRILDRFFCPVVVLLVLVAGSAAAAPSPAPLRRLYPTVEQARVRREQRANQSAPPPLKYHGGVNGIGITVGQPKIYLVFWGSQWGSESAPGSLLFGNDQARVAPRLKALFDGLGTSGELWSGVATQYCEGVPAGAVLCPSSAPHVPYPAPGVLAGIWVDTALAAPAAATAFQIGAKAVEAAAHFGNVAPESNRNAQYVIVSPKGAHPDGFNTASGGFCAWHTFNGDPSVNAPSPYGDVAFTNLPYMPDMGTSCGQNFVNAGSAGLLDGVTMVEGHEFSETITDQNPGGGWWDAYGQENADKCAWISDGPGRSQNVAFATGSFAMQSTWSNDGAACLIAHPVWGVPGLPTSYVLGATPLTRYLQPGDTGSAIIQATTVTGDTQPLALSASGVPPDATVTLSSSSIQSDEAATLTVETSPTTPLGFYPITVTATGAADETSTFAITVGPPPPLLQRAVPLTNLSGPAGSDQVFELDVPNFGFTLADLTIGGGIGDADLFLRKDAVPTDDAYDCKSDAPSGSYDSCPIYNQPGTWFVRVHGFTAYSGLSLYANYGFVQPLFRRETVTGIDGTAGSANFFWISVPTGRRHLTVTISRTLGDADLHMRLFRLPNPLLTDCHKVRVGQHRETCVVKNPYPGTYYIGVYGVTDYSRLSIKATY
jgi:serine protease